MRRSVPSVLVVDDDEHFRALARALLSSNFEVEEATGVTDCVRLMRSRSFDAVILDLVMPDRDGIEGIRDIKECAPETRIVAVSGYREGDLYLRMARFLGAHATLSKTSIEKLGNLLERVLREG